MKPFARIVVTLLLALPVACEHRMDTERYSDDEIVRSTGGDPELGVRLIRCYGCPTCHEIPGVPGAHATVGPSLDRIAQRVYLAGRLENNLPNMVRWIRHPRGVDSLTVMPDMGVSEQDARDITAFLYTLR
jgi:cytochrome c